MTLKGIIFEGGELVRARKVGWQIKNVLKVLREVKVNSFRAHKLISVELVH